MTDQKISELLKQLHNELENMEAVDEKGRELLKDLNADITKLLERSEGGASDESLLERWQDTIDHFEVTHPALTTALSQMLNVLSNAGI